MTVNEQLALLHRLCQKLRSLSQTVENEEKRQHWKQHNLMTGNSRPLLWVCPDDDGGWQELIGDLLVCEDRDLRSMEFQLRKQIFHGEHFHDDFVFEPILRFDIPGLYTGYHYGKAGPQRSWGIPIKGYQVGRKAYGLKCAFDYNRDMERFLDSEVDFIENTATLNRLKDKYEQASKGVLEIQFNLPYVVLVQSLLIELVHLRGLQELMYDLIEQPNVVSAVLGHMSASKARLLDKLENEKRLFDNRTNIYTGSGGLGYTDEYIGSGRLGYTDEYIGSGGLGYTDEYIGSGRLGYADEYIGFCGLSRTDANTGSGGLDHTDAYIGNDRVKLDDMWGFADAQEFSCVSPSMFEEFALKHQAVGLNKFGMASYGCCEPLDDRLELIFRHIPRLRRISVSPWSNPVLSAEKIGRRAIFSWKPNPVEICTGFNYDTVRKELVNVAAATKNCTTEVILKDIRTCGKTPIHLKNFIKCFSEVFE